jgi:hypothetical protein
MHNHIKVLLYTSPAYKTYVQNLNKQHFNKTINVVEALRKAYSNVFYFNCLNNKEFFASDFYDADHLDNLGAQKFTREIDSLLFKIEKLPDNKVLPALASTSVH